VLLPILPPLPPPWLSSSSLAAAASSKRASKPWGRSAYWEGGRVGVDPQGGQRERDCVSV
jgi:hypothetical protein